MWDPTVFTKNRDWLQNGDVFAKFMTKLLNHPQVKPLLSDEHFSVDGTLIEAWASQKSFRPKDGSGDDDGGANFHGYACERERSRLPTLPQGGRAGGEALLHGPRHNGEPAWAGGGRHGHARHRHR
jgi:hypothetical protein